MQAVPPSNVVDSAVAVAAFVRTHTTANDTDTSQWQQQLHYLAQAHSHNYLKTTTTFSQPARKRTHEMSHAHKHTLENTALVHKHTKATNRPEQQRRRRHGRTNEQTNERLTSGRPLAGEPPLQGIECTAATAAASSFLCVTKRMFPLKKSPKKAIIFAFKAGILGQINSSLDLNPLLCV